MESIKIFDNVFANQNKKVMFLFNKKINFDNSIKKILNLTRTNKLGNFSCCFKLYMVGLGYKNFLIGNRLYILIGDCNYLIFAVPVGLTIFCFKNQIYILSYEKLVLGNFINNLLIIKKLNYYKGKGVLQFKGFKFTKLKVGKKQKFA
jgi:hypothetical protein